MKRVKCFSSFSKTEHDDQKRREGEKAKDLYVKVNAIPLDIEVHKILASRKTKNIPVEVQTIRGNQSRK